MKQGQQRILVVDDHQDTREAVRTLLEGEGYAVSAAGDGKQAIDLLVSDNGAEPCLIILDLEMPVMTGWEFLDVLSSYDRLRRIPVLVVSGNPAAAGLVDRGAADYLHKPFDSNASLAKLKACARH